MHLRAATLDDIPAVAAIYGDAVRTSIATFDTADPDPESWTERIASAETGDHFLVAEGAGPGVGLGPDEQIVGFAYSSAFRTRPAYAATRETTVYLAEDARGRGVGRALYEDLLRLMTIDRVHLAVAVVSLPNPGSLALHRSLGFVDVGTMHEVGFKFGRWIDTLWLERRM